MSRRPPNIIFILAADLGYGEVGCYGQRLIATPSIDRLAGEGLRFRRHYTGGSVCGPSRACLLTGQSQAIGFIKGNPGGDPRRENLRAEDATLASMLHGVGYETACIGKWGLGPRGFSGYPTRKGFGHFVGYDTHVSAHDYYPQTLCHDDGELRLASGTYSHDVFTERALEFIARPHQQPDFLYLAYTIPHSPYNPPDLGPYVDRDWPPVYRSYAAMITRMDRDLGRLLDTLERDGQDRDTLVIFTSDNGPQSDYGDGENAMTRFFACNGGKRGIKRDLYVGGILVPYVTRWPGVIAAGSTTDHVAAFQDVVPTLGEIAGFPVAGPTDGISYAPTLLGRPAEQRRHDRLYWEFIAMGQAPAGRQSVLDVASGVKGVRFGSGSPIRLRDLAADPGEQVDLAEPAPTSPAPSPPISTAAARPANCGRPPGWSAAGVPPPDRRRRSRASPRSASIAQPRGSGMLGRMPHPPFALNHADASLTWDGNELRLATAAVTRTWRAVPGGLATTSFGRTGRPRLSAAPSDPDWLVRGISDRGAAAVAESCTARLVDDDPGITAHLAARFTWLLPDSGWRITWEVRAHPAAAGTWTRLELLPPRALSADERALPSWLGWSFAERVPMPCAGAAVVSVGLHADTQHRNFDHTPLLERQAIAVCRPGRHGHAIEAANLVTVTQGGEALTVVKESHKTLSHPGLDTGAFVLRRDDLVVTGLGLMGNDYGKRYWAERVRPLHCWATWSLLHEPGAGDVAVKAFDRLRFPLRSARDDAVVANTWGSGGAGWPSPNDEGSFAATGEEAVLAELAACADLGVEVLQIDHGWHFAPRDRAPGRDSGEAAWRPHPQRLPGGWQTLRERAATLGVGLGLWFPWHVDEAKILWNVREGGFRRVKLDFMGLSDRPTIEDLHDKLARLRAGAGPDLGIDWDVTEAGPRVGYFTLRDFGNLYLENRENGPPPLTGHDHIRYTPRLTLRDVWQLAQVLNLERLQITVQNVDLVIDDYSDCRRYGHAYAFAIAFLAQPILFQQTQRLSPAARDQLRPLIALHKAHRARIRAGTVHPIGEEPDGASWTGLQSAAADGSGYLVVFRELDAVANQARLPLHGLAAGTTLAIEDLRSGTTTQVRLDDTGSLAVAIAQPAGFAILRYRTA